MEASGTELEAIEEEGAVVATAPVVSAAQKRSAVYQHPKRQQIEAMIMRGKSAHWIEKWLEDEYPTTLRDDKGFPTDDPHPKAVRHKRWQLRAQTIERYRSAYLPEYEPGVDLLGGELEDIIGRRPPPDAPRAELQVMEAGIQVAEHNLTASLKSDKKMGFVTPASIEANKAMIDAAKTSAEMKGRFGVPGYEFAAEKQEIQTTNTNLNKNLSVELYGKIGKDGKPGPGEPEKVTLAKKFLDMSPEETKAVIATAEQEAVRRMTERGDVEGSATEIPKDKEMDDGEGNSAGA